MIARISRRDGFARFAGSRAVRHGGLSLRVVPDDAAGAVCLAFATPKRIGSAVTRNRVRRQLRALVRARSAALPHGWYLLGVEQPLVDNDWGQLGMTLDRLLGIALPNLQSPDFAAKTTNRSSM